MPDDTVDRRALFVMGGGGFSMEPENLALDRYILARTGKEHPKVSFLPTASGDAQEYIDRLHDALPGLEAESSHLSLIRDV